MDGISIADIRKGFDSRDFSRGLEYFNRGNVISLKLRPDGLLVGEVRGSYQYSYEAEVYWVGSPKHGFEFVGECSCPVGFNCKHVVALLLQLVSERQKGRMQDAPKSAPTMDWRLRDWLEQIDAATRPVENGGYPAGEKQRLIYILNDGLAYDPALVYVEVGKARLRKDGGFSRVGQYNPGNFFSRPDARFVHDSDRFVLRMLTVVDKTVIHAKPVLRGMGSEDLLRSMLATGRCYWRSVQTGPLSLAGPRQARWQWEVGEDGSSHLSLQPEPPALALSLSSPWYIDESQACCGPLDCGLDAVLATVLMRSPPIPPQEMETVISRLSGPAPSLPAPETLELRRQELSAPTPCLRLEAVEDPDPSPYDDDPEPISVARLGFDYGEHGVWPLGREPQNLPRAPEGVLMQYQRDQAAEEAAVEILASLGLYPMGGFGEYMFDELFDEYADCFLGDVSFEDEPLFWMEFFRERIPVLRDQGWRVEIGDKFPVRIAQVGNWYMQTDDDVANHWFDLELGLEVNGNPLNLLPLIEAQLKSIPPGKQREWLDGFAPDAQIVIRMEDDSLLSLPISRIRSILETVVEMYDRETPLQGGRLRLPELNAPLLDQLQSSLGEDSVKRSGDRRLKKLARRLQSFKGIKVVKPPRGFQAELREYQQQGLNWLQFLREYELGGILADDMGLGKTVQTLAHILKEKQARRMTVPTSAPALVVAPTSLMANWRLEAERFAPSLKTLVIHGPGRKADFARMDDVDLVLTTYPLIGRDLAHYQGQEFHLLILDEAQNIKNPRAKAAQALRQINARHRLCLTGTPMENHLGELWSILGFAQPGLLGDEKQFRQLFRNPIEKHADARRHEALVQRIRPFLLRRTKEQVAAELPPKTEIIRSVELEGAQRQLYETIRVAVHDKVRRAIEGKGLARSQIEILDALLKLRQACCDPGLVKLPSAKKVKTSAKLDLLMTLLPELLEEGRRVLLFSQFTSMLTLIEKQLTKHKIPFVKLTGQTRNREIPIQRFQTCEVPLFLISLKAGGVGLNLTAADTVIHYDPWWNPAVENQATDRAHRIGQDKPVFVYKLLTENTVEQKIQEMQQKKKVLADSLFSEKQGKSLELDAETLTALFQPLDA